MIPTILKGTVNMKHVMLFVCFLSGVIHADAQRKNFGKRSTLYYGMEASFGYRSFSIESNIDAINGLKVVQEGATAGLTVGNDMFRSRLQVAGFYYTTGNIPYSIDLIESAALINIYPLALAGAKSQSIKPYLTGGFSYYRTRYYGFYLQEKSTTPQKNYSVTEAPYLGNVNTTMATIGGGIEYAIPAFRFVRIFADVQYGIPMATKASQEFTATRITPATAFSIGACFGSIR
jgi:hypothetical protein